MTKRLLMQSDDYGITEGVSAGIRRAAEFDLIRNTGMFVNMPASVRAAADISGYDICLGIDINYVCGRPVSDPADVPHLIDENGDFISSGKTASRSRFTGMDELGVISYFEEDPYPYDEILLETENQVKRFIELTGKRPEYIHPHSLTTENCLRAAKEVAEKYGIIHTTDVMRKYPLLPGTFDGSKGSTAESQMEFDVIANLTGRGLPAMKENETRMFVCHCGYADYDLFRYTSLTLRRIKDLAAMTSETLKRYLSEHGIEPVTYRDLA